MARFLDIIKHYPHGSPQGNNMFFLGHKYVQFPSELSSIQHGLNHVDIVFQELCETEPQKTQSTRMSQVEEAVVTTGIGELAAAVSGLGDLAKSTPKRRSEPKAKADPKKKRRKA